MCCNKCWTTINHKLNDRYMTSPHACIYKKTAHFGAVMTFFFIGLILILAVVIIISYLPNQYQLPKND